MAEKYTLSQTIDTTSNVTRLADYPGGIDTNGGGYQIPLVSAGEAPIAVADFNKDGNLDLLTGGSFYTSPGGYRIFSGITTLYLGDAKGKFGNPQSYHVGSPTQYVGDFNKDGNLDVLIIGEFYSYAEKATLLPGDGKGGFGKAIESTIVKDYSLSLSELLGVADYNHDGNADIIMESPSYEPPELRIAFGDGTGKFGLIESKPKTIADSFSRSQSKSATGDINKDEKPDYVTSYPIYSANSRTDIAVFLNLGDETQPPELDLNGDKTPDQVVFDGSNIGVFLNQPKINPAPLPTQPQPQPLSDPVTGTKVADKIVGTQVDASLRVANQRNFRIGSGQPLVWKHDRIGDFVHGQDTLVLNNETFGLGEDLSFAQAKSAGKAKLSSADLVYVRGTGKLFYNENQEQRGFGKGGLIVDLADGLNLRKSDILLSLG